MGRTLGCALLGLLVHTAYSQAGTPADATTRAEVASARTLPAGTPLSLETTANLPQRAGAVISTKLLYPLFVDNILVVPAGTTALGRVTSLTPDRSHRLNARLRGDFTPFRTPVVVFDQLVFADGTTVPMATTAVTDGAPILRLNPVPPVHGGFLKQRFHEGVQMLKDRVAVITGPDKKDRLVQLLYTQLPYHPQRIQKGTAWTAETSKDIALPATATATAPQAPATAAAPATTAASDSISKDPDAWTLQAYLKEPLSSQNAHSGDPVHAVVAAPIFTADHQVAVPQGAVLEGSVTKVRPARWFARAGVLRFDFRQITFPNSAQTERVQTNLAGIDAIGGQNLALDSEGNVQPKPQSKIAVPLILFALAARPLDRDGGDNAFGKDAVASNSLGVVGFIVGTAGGWANVASGIGYYGTALAFYNRWIKRGAETKFPLDTRVVLRTSVRRSSMLSAPSK